MRGGWRSAAGCLQLTAMLAGFAAVPAAATGPATVALTAEQVEDRSNFIGQVRKARQGDVEAQWQVGRTYAKLGDPERALPMLTSAAGAGNAPAATLLGWLYEDGRGTERSIEEAKRWYRLAAEQGEADAMAALGRLLLQEKSPAARATAGQLFRRAAELQDPDGQYYVGWILTEVANGPREHVEAYDWFLKAARQGHVGAQLAVATHLETGRGVARDTKAAGEWLQRAAETRDPVAHYRLARWRAAAGEGNVDAVRDSYRIAAMAGHREAQFALASMLARSRAEADRKEAAAWFAKADEAGHTAAANRLGELLRDGGGDAQQMARAREIFQRAADRGNVDSMYNLARMQNEGLGGQRDTDNALKWYAQAADEGHDKASEVLGSLLSSSVKTSSLGLKGFWQ